MSVVLAKYFGGSVELVTGKTPLGHSPRSRAWVLDCMMSPRGTGWVLSKVLFMLEVCTQNEHLAPNLSRAASPHFHLNRKL